MLYEWDSPNLNSPVKRRGKVTSTCPPDNCIHVFTRLPDTEEEMTRFFKSRRVQNSRDVHQELFCDRAAKNVAALLKGGTAEVGLNLVDTGCLFRGEGPPGSQRVRAAFEKALKSVRGRVTDYSSLTREVEEGGLFASCVTSWFVPDPRPFEGYLQRMDEKKKEGKAELLKLLQRQCLPPRQSINPMAVGAGSRKRKSRGSADSFPNSKVPRRFSGDSLASHASSSRRSGGSHSAAAGEAATSRGQKLVRLSSSTLENRKQVEAERAEAAEAAAAARMQEERRIFKEKLKEQMEGKDLQGIVVTLGRKQASAHGQRRSYVEFLVNVALSIPQAECIRTLAVDSQLVFLAETTVLYLLEHLKAKSTSPEEVWGEVENIFKVNFLVDPMVVRERKTKLEGKLRDWKLQVSALKCVLLPNYTV